MRGYPDDGDGELMLFLILLYAFCRIIIFLLKLIHIPVKKRHRTYWASGAVAVFLAYAMNATSRFGWWEIAVTAALATLTYFLMRTAVDEDGDWDRSETS